MSVMQRSPCMKSCAVICEFNLFHNGHASLLQSIRREFGEDTCIIALMSGNYTERGDIAIADKFLRAEAAVYGGADLVLEIPFPFSSASAEHYARIGVAMAEMLNGVDYLAFGSESGDMMTLETAAVRSDSPEFKNSLREALRAPENKTQGYARLCYEVYASLYGREEAAVLLTPNNMLAIQYLRALKRIGSSIRPFTVRRTDDHHGKNLRTTTSSSAIRESLLRGKSEEAFRAMPEDVASVYRRALREGLLPVRPEALSSVLLAHFRCSSPPAGDGIGYRFLYASRRVSTIEEALSLVATKRYTNAYLRRAMWYRYFGIASPDNMCCIRYTQILGMNGRGQKKLAELRGRTHISLLTKPADAIALDPPAKEQAALAAKADSVFALALPSPFPGDYALRRGPFRKK